MQLIEDDMRMKGGYPPPPPPQISDPSDRHGEGNFGGGVLVLVPTTIEEVVNLPVFMTEATRITVVGDHHQVISLQTIVNNSIHHHRIIGLHQAVWI